MCLVLLIDFVDGIKESKVTVFKSNKTERTNLPNKWIHRKSDNVLFPVLENIDLSTSDDGDVSFVYVSSYFFSSLIFYSSTFYFAFFLPPNPDHLDSQ
jgi:hypothetical protein